MARHNRHAVHTMPPAPPAPVQAAAPPAEAGDGEAEGRPLGLGWRLMLAVWVAGFVGLFVYELAGFVLKAIRSF